MEFVKEGICSGDGVTFYRVTEDKQKGMPFKTVELELSEEEHCVLMDEVLNAHYADFMVTVAREVGGPLHISGPTHHVDGLMKAYKDWIENLHPHLKA